MLRLSWDQISWLWQVSWLGLDKGLDATSVGGMSVFPSWGRPSVEHAWNEDIRRWGGAQSGPWLDLCMEGELFSEAVISLWDFFLAHPICNNFMICLGWHWLSAWYRLESSEKRNLSWGIAWISLNCGCLWRTVLFINWCKRAQHAAGSNPPHARGPGYLWKLAEPEGWRCEPERAS